MGTIEDLKKDICIVTHNLVQFLIYYCRMMLYVLLYFLGIQTRSVLPKEIHIHLYPDELKSKELYKKANSEESEMKPHQQLVSEEANRYLPQEDPDQNVDGNGQNRQYPLSAWAYSRDPNNAVRFPYPDNSVRVPAQQITFVPDPPPRPKQTPYIHRPPPYVPR